MGMIALLAGLLMGPHLYSPQKDNPLDRRRASQPQPVERQEPVALPVVASDAPGQKVLTDTQWLLKPGVSAGPITAKSTLADLQKAFGAKNVKAGEIPGPEGTTLEGAVIFPLDTHRQVEVIWQETRQLPESVRISGRKTLWHTAEGVTLGTKLSELEKLNGAPITITGFGWDYGGTVIGWSEKGALRKPFQKDGHVVLRLDPPDTPRTEKLLDKVSGDQEFSSANPAMQKLNPTVSQMIVGL